MTAAHVFYMAPDFTSGKLPILFLYDNTSQMIGLATSDDYELLLPAGSQLKEGLTIDGRKIQTPEPDIIIVRFRTALVERISKMPNVKLSTYEPKRNENLTVAGLGSAVSESGIESEYSPSQWRTGRVM